MRNAAPAEKREREAREKAEKQRQAKEEAERLAAEKKKKKPIRYPTEDLDIRVAEKDKKAGIKVKRPVPNRAAIPFNNEPGTFESFLMGWNFLVVYGLVVLICLCCSSLTKCLQPTPSSLPVHLRRIRECSTTLCH